MNSQNSLHLNAARGLANVLGDSALHAHFHGNDREALERVRDVFSLAHAVEQEPTLVAELVAIGIDALALDRLHIINAGRQLRRLERRHHHGSPIRGDAPHRSPMHPRDSPLGGAGQVKRVSTFGASLPGRRAQIVSALRAGQVG
jgi:hypothetical protein